MPNPIQSAIRAIMERAVEGIAAYNRNRLPNTPSPFAIGVHAPTRHDNGFPA